MHVYTCLQSRKPPGVRATSVPRLIVALLLLSLALHLIPAAAAQDISGEYRHRHTIRYFGGEHLHTLEAEDTLSISRVAADTWHFAIETVAGNGHTCSMAGTADLKDGHLQFAGMLDLAPDQTGGKPVFCELRLVAKGGTVTLRDRNRHCRIYYCGMRAGLEGLVFRRERPHP